MRLELDAKDDSRQTGVCRAEAARAGLLAFTLLGTTNDEAHEAEP